MLELLDSVIAFVAILLGVSLVITVLVQAVASSLNLRGIALVKGLRELFELSGFDRARAQALADQILCHPMVSDSILPKAWRFFARASAIRKDELARVLADAGAFELGLATPGELASLKKAEGLVKDWFDGKMDRASQVFAQSSRIVTVVLSFATAFLLHLDAAHLFARVSSDAEVRGKLVASVESLSKSAEEIERSKGDRTPVELSEAAARLKAIQGELSRTGIELLPAFGPQASLRQGVHTPFDFTDFSSDESWRHLLGILAAGAFLCLGAPFWFNVLKSLTNLRSIVANKEAAEREEKPASRVGTQGPGGVTGGNGASAQPREQGV